MSQDGESVTPRRLELSLSPENGSLLTVPLSTVLLTLSNGLYTDLYNMAHGEMEVAQSQQSQQSQSAEGEASGNNNSAPFPTNVSTKKEKMSNLSFAQRRNELGWRLGQHSKSFTHLAGLTATAFSNNGHLGKATKVATTALQRARTAWVQADEAQDALFFFHARLFQARQAPHDVLGSLDICRGQWRDLPTDLQLKTDQYENSDEGQWTSVEVADRWHMAVRDKLVRGEVGWMQRQRLKTGNNFRQLWRISLRGGVVRLTHGTPRRVRNQNSDESNIYSSVEVYPLEAQLTVLSTLSTAEWTLLSVEVRAEAKTGESNHQLETTKKHRYDLHRLCAQAMTKEEERIRKQHEGENGQSTADTIARPLDRLFRVAHAFSLSWQLQILSAQAQALKRGDWGSSQSSPSSGLVISPVEFNADNDGVLGEMSISFWSVDDRYGPPQMGDLAIDEDVNKNSNDFRKIKKKATTTGQLMLSIRAEANLGIRVSLSGGSTIMETLSTETTHHQQNQQMHAQKTVEQLIDAASNPFALSAGDALLAATRLCAERKCHAVVQALQPDTSMDALLAGKDLPSWIRLTVEHCSVEVAAKVSYGPLGDSLGDSTRPFVVLFRLACDARTGAFVPTFSRSATLLRLLACNDVVASDTVAVCTAKQASHRRKGGAAFYSTGRAVRDAFDALSRSMNVLGQRTGVGGYWDDTENESSASLLRQRAIQLACTDVKMSLMTCCGMAAVYGLSALALGIGTGVNASVDIAGGPLEPIDGVSFLSAPPVSVVVDQEMIQKSSPTSSGDKKKKSFLERDLFAISCVVSDAAVTIYGFDVTISIESPSSPQERLNCSLVKPKESSLATGTLNGHGKEERPQKRARIENVYHTLLQEVESLASIFRRCIEIS